ncbi:nucleoside diphosphate-linked moiety X motif 19 isoform X2 [Camponotus floridanus]|nr:nucleoside diphosphate-linked moiety X motif 19 isoform X2 [Camponotus floridanus]
MPGMYVFPGGAIDSVDSTPKWREIFAAFGVNNDRFASLEPKIATRPEIYRSIQNELPREISLRITAIRETFEESGILICRHKNDRTVTNWAKFVSLPKDELQMWQTKVHNNATDFLALCEKLECYPDLWALREWRNWLTPTDMPKRFNNMLYLACLPSIPYAEYEALEMEDLKWERPEDLLSVDGIFPLPQQCEIARFIKIKSIDELIDLTMEQRNIREALQLYFPVRIQLKDGEVCLLPEDTMYPKEVNLLHKQKIDKSDITIHKYREMTRIKNRIEYRDTQIKIIFTDSHGKDNCVEFSSLSYSKAGIKNISQLKTTKNKL